MGTRLHPLTAVRAKPALPVAGEPLVRRIVAVLAAERVNNITVNLHHLPHTLTAVLGDGADLGARVRYSWEVPRLLGSAGGPRQALDIIGAQTFWLINGDTLTDVDLAAMAREHRESGARVTLALVPNREFLRYGGVGVAADGTVVGFVSRGPAAAGSWHMVGTQLVEYDVFAGIPPGDPAHSIGGIYDRLVAERPGAIRAFRCDAAFWDIGTVSDYWRTSQQLAGDNDRLWEPGVDVPSSARVDRSILWRGARVGDRADLDECIVTDDVVVPAGATYSRTILLRGANGAAIAVPMVLD
jgi:NDP-sugar pyrophosphorylase family protein